MRADWTVLDRNGAPLLRRSAALSVPAGTPPSQAGAGQAVSAMSTAIGLLADRIAAGVDALPGC